ncbi:MAG: hypothetical protein Metus_0639 [Candidatus Methanosuratincola subterraneus]|uniref:Uncharacterized protein n=1 Tax=Methanosuratincola subterraneus TaxID=2593994 RepID=A0A444L8K4_METS7|nr:MAG: hypothetical protein Metus_0639 [Candidatus Methanosuratincola subterraneus]
MSESAASSKLGEIKAFLDQGKPFEVKYDGEAVCVSEAKGVVKISLSKEETKGIRVRKSARKIPAAQKEFVINSASILIPKRIPFKVTFGPKETTFRFDLDHYIHIYPEKCAVVGFKSLDELPVSLVRDLLSGFPNLKIYAPKG